MNLPNALSAGRIVVTPLIAVLPMFDSSPLRLAAFVLFVVAAITDYVDGYLARSRKEDDGPRKAARSRSPTSCCSSGRSSRCSCSRKTTAVPARRSAPIGLPLWIVLVVLAREVFMTVFRQVAKQQGRRDRRDPLREMEDGASSSSGTARPTSGSGP